MKRSDEGCNCYRLMEEILALSVSENKESARLEWDLERIFLADRDNPGKCLCGHFPILEHCVLKNRENGSTVTVGNVCVFRFLKLGSEKLFSSFRRIARNPELSLNLEAVEYAFDQGFIDEVERQFLQDTFRKSKRLSPKQLAWRVRIHSRILQLMREVDDA